MKFQVACHRAVRMSLQESLTESLLLPSVSISLFLSAQLPIRFGLPEEDIW